MPFILARIFREIWLPAFVQFGQAENTDTVMVVKACELFLESEFEPFFKKISSNSLFCFSKLIKKYIFPRL